MDNFDLKKYLSNNSLLKENLKFKDLNDNKTYTVTQNFSIFKKGDPVSIEKISPFGGQYKVYLKNSQGKVSDIIGDIEDEVEMLNEMEVKDPNLETQIEKFAELSDQIDKISNTLTQLKKEYSSISKALLPILEELEETQDRALETKNVLVTIKKKGFERTSYAYKEAFSWLNTRINPTMQKIVQEALEKTKKTATIASSIGVQKKINENKVTDALLKYWNMFKTKLSKFNSTLRQDIDTFKNKFR